MLGLYIVVIGGANVVVGLMAKFKLEDLKARVGSAANIRVKFLAADSDKVGRAYGGGFRQGGHATGSAASAPPVRPPVPPAHLDLQTIACRR